MQNKLYFILKWVSASQNLKNSQFTELPTHLFLDHRALKSLSASELKFPAQFAFHLQKSLPHATGINHSPFTFSSSRPNVRRLFKPGAIFPGELRMFRLQNKYRRARSVNEYFWCANCALGRKKIREHAWRTAQMKPKGMDYRSGRWLTSRVCRGSFITRSQQAPTSQAAANTPGVCMVNCTPVTRQGRQPAPHFHSSNSAHLCSHHSHYLLPSARCAGNGISLSALSTAAFDVTPRTPFIKMNGTDHN